MLRRWRLLAGLISVFGLVIAMIGTGALMASAGAGPTTQGVGHIPEYVCHATVSNSNPYVSNAPDISSIVKGEGHDGHNGPLWDPTLKGNDTTWGDIIPPFTYDSGNYPNQIYNGNYPGKNWSAAGGAVYNNGCQLLTSAITTAPQPAWASFGDLLKDQATLTGVYGATGSITFTLYNPANVAVHTESVPVSGNGGAYTTPTGHAADAAGTWHWKAEYSGDAYNKSIASDPADEPVGVSKMQPTLVTEPIPSSQAVGGTLKDNATLAGGYSPTGDITFTLYNPSDVIMDTESVAVSGNGVYSTPTGFVANTAGQWYWHAKYSGDGNNTTATGADEPVTVTEAERTQPTLSTTPNPGTAKVGDTLKDTATLGSGSAPTGTITFTLLDPSNAVVHTEIVDVSGNGSYSTPTGHVANTAGTWHWEAQYSGDTANKPVASETGSEPVTVTEAERAQPTLSTTPNPGTAKVGDTLKDTAALGSGSAPTGTITFTLLDPSNAVAHTETVDVDGNGSYSTPTGHVANVAGTWHWEATYSGDEGNKPVASEPGSEPVTVTQNENEPVQPAITTVPQPTSSAVGGTLKDKATLSAGNNPTGTITFTLYNPAGTAVHTETVTVSGNGVYTTPAGHVADVQGTWHWKAAYGGDSNNLPVSSNAADEPVAVGPGGGVLAATGYTSMQQALSTGLLAMGLLSILGALALRRRTA